MPMDPPPAKGKGKGGGKGGGKGKKKEGDGGGMKGSSDQIAKELMEMDPGVQAESNMEILRAQRAQARKGISTSKDSVRENEGIDEEDPQMQVDDGIRLEPFNMRREMAEGHFDEGGFYVTNQETEKQVTDAWLDTVDMAEKAATFKKEATKKKIGQKTINRLTALKKSLGKDEDEEEDEKEEKEGDEKADGEEGKEEEEEVNEPEPEVPEDEEEEEDAEDEIMKLESLVAELLPLESPNGALARWARAGSGAAAEKQPALKTRARMRQEKAKAAEEAKRKMAAAKAGGTKKKRRLTEWGWEEVADEPTEKPKPVIRSIMQEDVPAKVEGDAPKAADDAAVAAAAKKAEEQDKADKEAASAFAKEMKLTKSVLHEALGQAGPEQAAMANLNADDAAAAKDARKEALTTEGAQEVEPDNMGDGNRKRKAGPDDRELERRKKIARLTDLCDALLQIGCNVYDSTRESICIEIRERKGETMLAETEEGQEGKEGEEGGAEKKEVAAAAAPAAPVDYSNKRYKAADGEAKAVVDADQDTAGAAGGDGQGLLWQFRWPGGKPDEVHGPFNSTQMQGWVEQACFSEERAAEVRQCDASNQPAERCWHRYDKIDFQLYI